KFAAGPSTCSDEITSRHHRTVGEPGQGVDATLLCPAIKKCSPTPPTGTLAGSSEAAAKGLFERRRTHAPPGRSRTDDAVAGRNRAGDLRPRYPGPEGLCQSAGGPRLDGALSDRRRPACPSWR